MAFPAFPTGFPSAGATSGAGAALLGGPPGWLLAGLGLLPSIAGAFTPDPQERTRDELRRLASPEYLEQVRREIARRMGSSPSIQGARRSVVEAGSSLTQGLQRSLSARGLGTSGIASVAVPVSQSATAGRLAGLEGVIGEGSLSEAHQMIARQIAALMGTPYGQSNLQSGIGKSFEALLPWLQAMLKQRYPGVS